MRRPAEQRAPVEGEPEQDLRPPGEALGEGIDRDERQRGDAEHDRERRKAQEDREGHERLRHHPDHRRPRADLAAMAAGASGCARRGVDVAVGEVVPGAARPAHQHRAHGAARAIQRSKGREPARIGRGGQRQPHQHGISRSQVPIGRSARRQPEIRPDAGGREAVHPVAAGGVGDPSLASIARHSLARHGEHAMADAAARSGFLSTADSAPGPRCADARPAHYSSP